MRGCKLDRKSINVGLENSYLKPRMKGPSLLVVFASNIGGQRLDEMVIDVFAVGTR